MLRLLPPPGTGQGKRPRKRYASLSLSPEESARLRIVLKNLRAAYGTWSCLAEATDVSTNTLIGIAGGRPASPGILLRAARAGGISVERLLGGTLAVAGRCPHCGRSDR